MPIGFSPALELIHRPSARQLGQTPTIIGIGPVNSPIYIRDISGNLVATTKSDANGKFRVVVGQDANNTHLTITPSLATGANSLTPYLTSALTNPGNVDSFTVIATTTTSQVPVITKINGNAVLDPTPIIGTMPTVAGQGLAGQPVTIQALDANGNLILAAGSGTVAGDGTFSVTLTTPLPAATNYLSVTVGAVNIETTSCLGPGDH